MPSPEDEAKEAAEFTNRRLAAVALLQYARASRGLDEVRAILMDAGCLTPLFDAFVDGVRAARELRGAAPDPPKSP